MPKKKTKAEKAFRRVLAECERSGLSIRAFAAARGHSAGHLSWWRHEIRKRDAARGEQRPARVRSSKAKEAARTFEFLPVRVIGGELSPPPRPVLDVVTAGAGAGAGYEVVVAGGRRVLRLPRDFDAARVEALVRAVEAAC